jgi:hypothetical protein
VCVPWSRWASVLGTALAVLALGYGLAWVLYWPAASPATGIHQPLHYNETYVWPMAWTLHQAAPGVSPPSPLTLAQGDAVRQSFLASANNLAGLRVWLAGARGGEEIYVDLSDGHSGAMLCGGRLHLVPGGRGRTYALTFPAVADSAGREFVLRLQVLQGTAIARVGYVDRLPGQLRVNEYPVRGDLDVRAYHRGPPGVWTAKVVLERLLPQLVRTRIQQYKPVALKGEAFAILCGVMGLGVGILLWLSLSTLTRRASLAVVAPVTVVSLLLAGTLVFRWDVGAMFAWGNGVALAPGAEVQAPEARNGPLVRDLATGLPFVKQLPEPRQIQTQLFMLDGTRRACIAAPASSEIVYGFQVPLDAELRLAVALPEGATEPLVFRVSIDGDVLLARTLALDEAGRWHDVTLNLRPYAGRPVQLALVIEPAEGVQPFGGMPAGGPLTVAGLWAAPRLVSERTWLLGYPLAEAPSRPQSATFGGEIDLLGYELDATDVGPGGAVHVTLYWRAPQPIEADYTVFVHLLDAADEICGQHDDRPLGSTYPTNVWPSGVVVRDEHVVRVADDAQPGEYRLAVGLYVLATMDRLPLDSGGDRLVLDATLVLE